MQSMSDTQSQIERDSKGRFLSRPPGSPVITSDNARAMLDLREKKRALKRLAVQDAANVVAILDAAKSEHPEIAELMHNDDGMAYIRAIAIGRQASAMDADSPYGVASANWIVDNAGIAESKQGDQPGNVQVNVIRIVLHDDTDNAGAIDASIVDSD